MELVKPQITAFSDKNHKFFKISYIWFILCGIFGYHMNA
jgi:hypothetical protein